MGVDPAQAAGVSDRSRAKIAGLYPGLRPLAFRVLQDILIVSKSKMNVTDGVRSFEEQLATYSRGRQQNADGSWKVVEPGEIVTNARPGLSWHCYGLAFDCAWAGQDPYLEQMARSDRAQADLLWKTYGDVLRSHGLRWGGDFRLVNGVQDKPHGEFTYGLTIPDCLELHQHGGIAAVWAHIDGIRGVDVGSDWNLPQTLSK